MILLAFCIASVSAAQPNPTSCIPQKRFTRYDGVIKKYAKHYGFDWRLILAQIKQESAFNPQAKSQCGARGLMQLMPKTAAEMKVKNILNPSENIAAGIRYLRKQYDLFPDVPEPHRELFALASYNCGAGRLFDSRDIAKYELRPDHEWDDIQLVMPKLTKEYKELHLKIWQQPQPRYGYFSGWKETITYVANIWNYYLEYREQTI
ncbi:MAG: transglycosylase SLT domain-containing protein [bacterium]|nr:transglycosylase SLT domain-containing protein [bacterium]